MANVDSHAAAQTLRVEVVYGAAPHQVHGVPLELPAASTVADALSASGLLEQHALRLDTLQCGVWGRKQALDHPLRDGDRIELYRPLKVDPKEARRLRYNKQGRADTPGARRRPTGP